MFLPAEIIIRKWNVFCNCLLEQHEDAEYSRAAIDPRTADEEKDELHQIVYLQAENRNATKTADHFAYDELKKKSGQVVSNARRNGNKVNVSWFHFLLKIQKK